MKILFLGAAKRLSLLECFQSAAKRLNIDLSMYSVERDSRVPIAKVATILECEHPFKSGEFKEYLLSAQKQHGFDLVIPLMDSATVALSRMDLSLDRLWAYAVVSLAPLPEEMEDKEGAEDWFYRHGIPTPGVGSGFPIIVKSRFGFGARDQRVIHDTKEWGGFISRHDRDEYFIQEYIPDATEYTCDCYVDRKSRVVSVFIRERVEVEHGEVMVGISRHHPEIDRLCRKILDVHGWYGPICIQFLENKNGLYCLEVNPRFSGGATHGIHLGLDHPLWLMQEQLGMEIGPVPDWPSDHLMTRARRDCFFPPDA